MKQKYPLKIKKSKLSLRIYLVAYFQGLNLEDVYTYTGRGGEKAAEDHFERLTGISYPEYMQRRLAGEEYNEVLSEDDEGTEIYVLNSIHCAEGYNEVDPEGGVAKWLQGSRR